MEKSMDGCLAVHDHLIQMEKEANVKFYSTKIQLRRTYFKEKYKPGNSFDDKLVLKRLVGNFPKRKVDLA